MNTVRGKIVEGGRISVPASFRKALQLETGDTVLLRHDGEEMTVRPAKLALRRLQTRLRGRAAITFPDTEDSQDAMVGGDTDG